MAAGGSDFPGVGGRSGCNVTLMELFVFPMYIRHVYGLLYEHLISNWAEDFKFHVLLLVSYMYDDICVNDLKIWNETRADGREIAKEKKTSRKSMMRYKKNKSHIIERQMMLQNLMLLRTYVCHVAISNVVMERIPTRTAQTEWNCCECVCWQFVLENLLG